MDSWCLDKSSEDDLNTTTSSEEFSLLTLSSDEKKESRSWGRGDERTAVPRESLKSDGPNTDACGANASNATDAESMDSSCYIIDAESMGQGVLSELWAPASQVPEIGDSSLATRCDQRCDAMRDHRPGRESTPAKSCGVSLLLYGGAEPKKRDERLEELGAEATNVCYELEDDAPARTESQTIEGAHSSVSSGCPN